MYSKGSHKCVDFSEESPRKTILVGGLQNAFVLVKRTLEYTDISKGKPKDGVFVDEPSKCKGFKEGVSSL